MTKVRKVIWAALQLIGPPLLVFALLFYFVKPRFIHKQNQNSSEPESSSTSETLQPDSIQGKISSLSEKEMVIDSQGKKITVSLGTSAKFSYKYDVKTNTPGKQIEIHDFSGMKVGDYVLVSIDKKTVMVLNNP